MTPYINTLIMSNTPRTDAVAYDVGGEQHEQGSVTSSNFSRTLEQELNEFKKLALFEHDNSNMYHKERDTWKDHACSLEHKLDEAMADLSLLKHNFNLEVKKVQEWEVRARETNYDLSRTVEARDQWKADADALYALVKERFSTQIQVDKVLAAHEQLMKGLK